MNSVRALLTIAAALTLAACEEEPIRVGAAPPTPDAPPPPAAVEEVAASTVPAPELRDEDFVETDRNRDPFRGYASFFLPQASEVVRPQRDVVMPDTPLEDMRLIAIVSGVASPSAMIEDQNGTGHTVHRGDFIGREDVINAGGADGLPVTLNWRVDRIHGDSVILTRDDPTAPNRVPLTRVIQLHPEVLEGG
jgi:type IV pilus assembly protein PilP